MERGLYVAFTGTDGAGKSMQAGRLAFALRSMGRQSYFAESKDDFTNEILKSWLNINYNLGLRESLGNETMDIIKALDVLRDHARIVLPFVARGIDVIVPRSPACRIGLGRAYGSKDLDKIESLLAMYGAPDLTILLDIPAHETVRRVNARGHDEEGLPLMQRFGDALRGMADSHSLVRVDGLGTPDEVHARVLAAVATRFPELVKSSSGAPSVDPVRSE